MRYEVQDEDEAEDGDEDGSPTSPDDPLTWTRLNTD
jgi:hypothetical protein